MYTYGIAYGPALSDLLCVFRPNEWGSRVEVRRVLYPAYSTHDTLAQDAELNTNAELLSLWKTWAATLHMLAPTLPPQAHESFTRTHAHAHT